MSSCKDLWTSAIIYDAEGNEPITKESCELLGGSWSATIEVPVVLNDETESLGPMTLPGSDDGTLITLDSIVEDEKQAAIDGLIAEQEAEDSKSIMSKGGLEDMFKTVTDNDNDLEKISGETLDGGKFEFKNNRPNKDASNNQVTASTPFVAGTNTEGQKEAAKGIPQAVVDFLSGGTVGTSYSGGPTQDQVGNVLTPTPEQDISALLPILEPTIDPTLDPSQAQIGQPVDDSQFVETMDQQLNNQGLNDQMMAPMGGPEEAPLDLMQAFTPEEVLESPEDVIAASQGIPFAEQQVVETETVDLSEDQVLEIVESPELATANLEKALVNTGEIDNPVAIEAVNDFVAKVDEVAQALADGSIELLSGASEAAEGAQEVIAEAGEWVADEVGNAIDQAGNVLAEASEWAEDESGRLQTFAKAVTIGAGGLIAVAGEWVVDEAGNAIDEAGAIIAEAGDWIENAAGELESTISEGIDSASETAGELIASAGEWVETDGGELVDQAGNMIAEAGEWLLDTAGNAVMAIVGAPVVAAEALFDGVTGLFSSEEEAKGAKDKDATSWIADLMAGFTKLTGITSQEIMRALLLYAGSRLFGYSAHDSAQFAFKGFADGVQDDWTAQMKDHTYWKKEVAKIDAKYKGNMDSVGHKREMAALQTTVGNNKDTYQQKRDLITFKNTGTIGVEGAKGEIKKVVKQSAVDVDATEKVRTAANEESDSARTEQARNAQLRAQLDEIEGEFGTGEWFGNLKQAARSIFTEVFGAGAVETATGEILFNRTIIEVLKFISQTKGAISEKEMKVFTEAAMGRMKSPLGLKLLLETSDRIADWKIKYSTALATYIDDWKSDPKKGNGLSPKPEKITLWTNAYHKDNMLKLPTAKMLMYSEGDDAYVATIAKADSKVVLDSIFEGQDMSNLSNDVKQAYISRVNKGFK